MQTARRGLDWLTEPPPHAINENWLVSRDYGWIYNVGATQRRYDRRGAAQANNYPPTSFLLRVIKGYNYLSCTTPVGPPLGATQHCPSPNNY